MPSDIFVFLSSFNPSLKTHLFQQSYWLCVGGGGGREWETERWGERTSCLSQSVRVFLFFFSTYFVSCNGPCAPKEKWLRKEHITIIIIIIPLLIITLTPWSQQHQGIAQSFEKVGSVCLCSYLSCFQSFISPLWWMHGAVDSRLRWHLQGWSRFRQIWQGKMWKNRFYLEIRKLFSQRVVNLWNWLPRSVVGAENRPVSGRAWQWLTRGDSDEALPSCPSGHKPICLWPLR